MDDKTEPGDSPFSFSDNPNRAPLSPPPLPEADTVSVGSTDETVDTKWIPSDVSPPPAAPPLPPTPPIIGSPESAPEAPFETPPALDFSFLGSVPEPVHQTVTDADLPIIDKTRRDMVGVITAMLGPVLWVAGIGGIWYFLTRGSDPVVSADNWPSLSTTWDTLKDMVDQEAYRDDVLDTALRMVLALSAGGALGLAVGVLSGQNRVWANLLRPLVSLFRLLSPVLFIFVFAIWWGFDSWIVWTPAALAVFAISSWTASYALHDTRRSSWATEGELVARGVRTSLPVAWPILYASEHLIANSGIGQALLNPTIPRMPEVVVWLLTALVLGLVFDTALRLIQQTLGDA